MSGEKAYRSYIGTTWVHSKTNGTYVIVDTCTIEDGWQAGFVYVATGRDPDKHRIVRPCTNFLDGRFVRTYHQYSEPNAVHSRAKFKPGDRVRIKNETHVLFGASGVVSTVEPVSGRIDVHKYTVSGGFKLQDVPGRAGYTATDFELCSEDEWLARYGKQQ